jgi:hypothetical protein
MNNKALAFLGTIFIAIVSVVLAYYILWCRTISSPDSLLRRQNLEDVFLHDICAPLAYKIA